MSMTYYRITAGFCEEIYNVFHKGISGEEIHCEDDLTWSEPFHLGTDVSFGTPPEVNLSSTDGIASLPSQANNATGAHAINHGEKDSFHTLRRRMAESFCIGSSLPFC